MILYEDENDSEQRWKVTENADGSYCLSPSSNLSLNLAVKNQSTASNAKVVLAAKNPEDLSQKWFIDTVTDMNGVLSMEVYYLRNKQSGKYLDLQGNGTSNYTHFQQYQFYDSGNGISEQFKITGNFNGYYTVKTMLTSASMVMDVQGTAQTGSQVILYEDEADTEQRWYFRRNEDDGTYTISPSSNSQLVLAIDNGATANNAKVKMQTRNFTTDANNNKIFADNQKWYLEPIDAESFDFEYLFSYDNYHNTISQGFNPTHPAIDFYDSTINGAPIYSPVYGTVVGESADYGTGNYIVIETDTAWPGTGENVRLGFAHMMYQSPLNEGDRVVPGQLIGYVGNTGTQDSGEPYDPHLHFSAFRSDTHLWPDNVDYSQCINPLDFYQGHTFNYS